MIKKEKKTTKEIRARLGEGRESANNGFNCSPILHTYIHTLKIPFLFKFNFIWLTLTIKESAHSDVK